jgi:hypothetical protein
MSIEALKLALEAHKKNERHQTVAETRYWCQQYKLLAEQFIQAIEQAEQAQPVAWRNAALRVGEDLSSVGPDGYYDMNAEQWLDWAMAQEPRGKTSLNAPPRQPLTDEGKDAQRWRFLVDNSYDKEGVTQFHVWEHSWMPHSKTFQPTEWKQRVRGPSLNDFIDRAIEAKLKEKNT